MDSAVTDIRNRLEQIDRESIPHANVRPVQIGVLLVELVVVPAQLDQLPLPGLHHLIELRDALEEAIHLGGGGGVRGAAPVAAVLGAGGGQLAARAGVA